MTATFVHRLVLFYDLLIQLNQKNHPRRQLFQFVLGLPNKTFFDKIVNVADEADVFSYVSFGLAS